MITPPHIAIIEQLPHWDKNHDNSCKQKIKNIMKKYKYDDDDIEAIDDRFCEGWQIARDIAIELLCERYYDNYTCTWHKNDENQIVPDSHAKNNISLPVQDETNNLRFCPVCGKIIAIKPATDQEFQEFLEQNREKIHKIIPTNPAITKATNGRMTAMMNSTMHKIYHANLCKITKINFRLTSIAKCMRHTYAKMRNTLRQNMLCVTKSA